MAIFNSLEHVEIEQPAIFREELVRLGHEVRSVRLYKNERLPELGAFDGLFVMGGPMNVDEVDTYRFLADETRFLTTVIQQDIPTMGICLGSQLLAKAAGARVYAKRPKEIGLFDIQWTDAALADSLFAGLPQTQEVFHWHGDTFDLPTQATLLASSARFPHQAFRIGRRVYALQFHLEIDFETLTAMRREFAAELADLPLEDRFEQFDNRLEQALAPINQAARLVIGRFANLATRNN